MPHKKKSGDRDGKHIKITAKNKVRIITRELKKAGKGAVDRLKQCLTKWQNMLH